MNQYYRSTGKRPRVPFPAAMVLTTSVEESANVGAAGDALIVTDPAVVAVLLEAIKIDLVWLEDDELYISPYT